LEQAGAASIPIKTRIVGRETDFDQDGRPILPPLAAVGDRTHRAYFPPSR
jgi:hypothetical protein